MPRTGIFGFPVMCGAPLVVGGVVIEVQRQQGNHTPGSTPVAVSSLTTAAINMIGTRGVKVLEMAAGAA